MFLNKKQKHKMLKKLFENISNIFRTCRFCKLRSQLLLHGLLILAFCWWYTFVRQFLQCVGRKEHSLSVHIGFCCCIPLPIKQLSSWSLCYLAVLNELPVLRLHLTEKHHIRHNKFFVLFFKCV